MNVCKLNNRADFLARVHHVLGWGLVLWTREGLDVITLSKLQGRAFDAKLGDWIIIYGNRVWFPYTSFKEGYCKVQQEKFKVGSGIYAFLSIDDPTTKEHDYSTVSAVYAHTLVESDIRPVSADKQRKAFARWIGDRPIRARIPLSALTTARTDVVADYVTRFAPQPRYVVLPYSSFGGLELQLRVLFAHLRNNLVLRWLWNKHHYCGLQYQWIRKDIGALYNDRLAIVGVGRNTTDAAQTEQWLLTETAQRVFGIADQPVGVYLKAGCLDEQLGNFYIPGV